MPRLICDTYVEPLRSIIIECLRQIGHTFDHCEQCLKKTTALQIHHTKYHEATVYDLELVCIKCNMQPLNKNLV